MKKLVICKECGENKLHCAFGLCKKCYNKEYKKKYRQSKKGKVVRKRYKQIYRASHPNYFVACAYRKWLLADLGITQEEYDKK